jgi:hypothetical protein
MRTIKIISQRGFLTEGERSESLQDRSRDTVVSDCEPRER